MWKEFLNISRHLYPGSFDGEILYPAPWNPDYTSKN